jgi:hypothetical protein
MADAADLKSAARKGIRVRISAPVPPMSVVGQQCASRVGVQRRTKRDGPEDWSGAVSSEVRAAPTLVPIQAADGR